MSRKLNMQAMASTGSSSSVGAINGDLVGVKSEIWMRAMG